jgi:hypothetical protein
MLSGGRVGWLNDVVGSFSRVDLVALTTKARKKNDGYRTPSRRQAHALGIYAHSTLPRTPIFRCLADWHAG